MPDKKPTKAELAKAKKLAEATEALTSASIVDVITAAHGEGTAQILGADAFAIQVRGICPTGIIAFDEGIGRGGIPYGRLTMLAGNEGSGKTTMALHAVAQCQKQGGIAMYQDMEYKLDPDLASKIGVDLESLIISQPPHMEACLAAMETTIRHIAKAREVTGKVIPMMIVLDSIHAALAKVELEGEYTDQHYAPQARVMSQGLKKIIPLAAKEMVALVFISQLREKVGVVYGSKSDTGAGKAPKFYSSVIAELRRTGSLKASSADNSPVIGNKVEAFFSKNQIAPPFKKAEFNIVFGRGADPVRNAVEYLIKKGRVLTGGAWFTYPRGDGEIKWQGMNNLDTVLAEHEGLAEEFIDVAYSELSGKKVVGTTSKSKRTKA